jgi:2-dehydro-3-deoxyglucarate aldolase/4-hydroxy-2-oxoheptanedioate aldolase
LRQRVLAGDTLFGTFVFGTSPLLVEVAARTDLDWLLVDLEHGSAHESQLMPLLMAAETSRAAAERSTPIATLVRVESGERIRVGRALDLGADGIMVPQVHSAAEARRVTGWMRTQPSGERGIALFTRGMAYGRAGHAGVATRHANLLTIVQIESQAALAEAPAIAAVEGVDVLFVGPADLTHALGIPGRIDHPDYLEAVAHVGRACASAGKAAGVMTWQADDVATYVPHGYRFFALASDANILDRALRAELAAARRAADVPRTEVP